VRLLCKDASVVGTPFFLYDYVEGRVLKDPNMPDCSAAERAAVYAEMARALAQLHSVDYRAAGLGDFGKEGGFIER
ncbi:MAG: phosphotransferase, partial [Stenotrophomonas sp.]